MRAALVLLMALIAVRTTAQTALREDPRLQRPLQMSASARTVREILAEIEVTAGVTLFVDTELAEEKLCVYAANRSAAEVLTAVSNFLSLDWRRNGDKPDAGYTLFQTPESKAAAAASAGARVKAQQDRILREIAYSKTAASLTPEERQRRNVELTEEAAHTDDRAKRLALNTEAYMLRTYNGNEGWRIGSALLRELPETEILALMSGEGVEYAWPAQSGARPVPTAAVTVAREVYNSANFGAAGDMNAMTVRISPVPGLKPGLQCVVFVGRRSTGGSSMRGFSVNLPLQTVDEPRAGAEPGPADWKTIEGMQRTVRLRPLVKQHPSKGLAAPILARAVADLQAQAPFNCIADAYWSNRLSPVDDRERPLGDALTEIAAASGHTWRMHDGFVMLRSEYAAADRMAEPPGDKMVRWSERSRASLLELDDLAEMAMVEDSRFSAMLDLMVDSGMSDEASALNGGRNHLRFYNSLTRAQRRKARELGIAYSDLSPAQQKFFRQAATTRNPNAYSSSFGREIDFANENPAKILFRIEFREADLWTYRDPGGSGGATVGGDREEAMEQVRRSFPMAQPRDLVAVKSSAALFTYAPRDSYGVRGFLRMPLRLRKPED
jgi:hypothetical protein